MKTSLVRGVVAIGIAVAFAAAPAFAQPSASGLDVGIAALRSQWKSTSTYIAAAAEELSVSEYAYRPIAGVRTFGEIVGHVAGTQNMICAAVLGDPQPAEDAIEKSATTKTALIAALIASNTYCAKAYAIGTAAAGAAVDMFGEKNTKIGVLALNAVHDGEHYGNIVTYMRMLGKIPPSSKR